MNSYHHGDLAAALLAATGELLAEKGVAGFSLRECARRAGVSHTAPAHHFGDTAGLLSAYAAAGFRALTDSLAPHAQNPDAGAALRAMGLAYVEFALAHPARYQLMFSSGVLRRDDAALAKAGQAAWACLASAVTAATGQPATQATDTALAWSTVHGLADLLINRQLALPPACADWREQVATVLARLAAAWRG
ncbi:TetR/AcrR family transcriptional regulator [Chitinilyticum litopenaei]|uniref:TetR/AcrR family transcriptional regulator n=1 Tax=Chitinilyticum litopenaei TaxID=1121276 RepID=UPI000423B0DC|nr:TetR-like C-terminal domain-containing protein [Chitinilyticum litopenaei]